MNAGTDAQLPIQMTLTLALSVRSSSRPGVRRTGPGERRTSWGRRSAPDVTDDEASRSATTAPRDECGRHCDEEILEIAGEFGVDASFSKVGGRRQLEVAAAQSRDIIYGDLL